jgi:tetratricopeptide (TPR) repeat protein
LDKAIEDYTQSIRLNPYDVFAYNYRGSTYGNKGELDKAIEDYTQAIRINPNDAMAYNNRGFSYEYKGEYDKAIEDCTQAIRIKPDYARAYNNRGFAYGNKGEVDKAIEDYTQAIRIKADYANAYFYRGLAYKTKGEADKAIEDCTQAIRIKADYAAAYLCRAIVYGNKKDYDKAIEDYTQAVRLDPGYVEECANRKGLGWLHKEDVKKSIEDIKRNTPEKAKTGTAESANGSAASGIPFEAYKGTDPYIFVSYAHKDTDRVFPIISEFHKAGFPVWYDEGIELGKDWSDDIAKALLKCSLFIVFISSSAAESENVDKEMKYALKNKKSFIHIWLEDTTLNPGLDMQISSLQGIMHFRMERENFYRKCFQSFGSFGIKTQKG